MSSSVSPLFQPLRLGGLNLQHRVVMAPLTRFRANKSHVHGELAKTYYDQRASVPGTLIIAEATFIAPQAAGYENVPGIWSDAQIAGWKAVRNIFSFALAGFADIQTKGHRRSARKGIVYLSSTVGPGAQSERWRLEDRRQL